MAKQNKRIRKKLQKKVLQQRFKGGEDLTFNQLLQKAEAADKRKRQIERRYKSNLDYAARNGVTVNITRSMTIEQVKQLVKQEKKRQQRIQRQENKIALLMGAGLTRQEAEEFKNNTFKQIYDMLNVGSEFTSKVWLGAVWWDSTGENDLRELLHEIQFLTLEEKIEKIKELYESALVDPDNSNDFRGVAQLAHGDSKKEVEKQIENYKKRGYWITIPQNFITVGISNKFTVQGVVDMLYLCIGRTSAQHRIRVYEEAEHFFAVNVPEIHKRVF